MRGILAFRIVCGCACLVLIGCGAMAGRGYPTSAPATPARPTPPPRSPAEPAPAPGFVEPSMMPMDLPAESSLARQVVYRGSMTIVVESISTSLLRIRDLAVSMRGYMQEMSDRSITVRIPAGSFEGMVEAVRSLGEITSLDIKGEDVTEQLTDLEIRLGNAEETRQRLLSLLEKGGKMDEVLAVAKELERITETIELLKGKLRYIKENVRFSTLTVLLNSPLPQVAASTSSPFTWVEDLASEIATGRQIPPRYDRAARRGPQFNLPDSYVRFYGDDTEARAMSADGVFIRVERHDNCEGGAVEFWSRLIRRTLVERRAVTIRHEPADLELTRGPRASILYGSLEVGREAYGYLVAVAAEKKYVYVFEAWGPRDVFSADQEKLEASAQSMRVK